MGSNTLGAASSAADFGWIWGWFWEAKIHDSRNFFDKKVGAKNEMNFGRLKIRILRPQKQIADFPGGTCTSGERNIGWGEMTWMHESAV